MCVPMHGKLEYIVSLLKLFPTCSLTVVRVVMLFS